MLALALTGGGGCGSTPDPTQAEAVGRYLDAAPPSPYWQAPARPPERTGPPRLTIPTLGVDVELVGVGVTPTGEHEVPATAGDVGWYTAGPTPGETGPALLLGHVDLNGTPGTFDGLHTLRRGDRLTAGGQPYLVTDVIRAPKTAFPDHVIYRRTTGPELTLVTCGGEFDGEHYTDNVIVTAAAPSA